MTNIQASRAGDPSRKPRDVLERPRRVPGRTEGGPLFRAGSPVLCRGSGIPRVQAGSLGQPGGQLRADARAGGGEFLAETAEAIERAPVLVWQPRGGKPEGRYKPDHFAEAAAQVVGSFAAAPQESVVVTMAEGAKRGLQSQQRQLVEEWRRAYQAEFQKYRAECLRTGVKGYKELSLFTLVGFAGGLGLGARLDALGFSGSAIGEWAVRTLSGEGEDLGEGHVGAAKPAATQERAPSARRGARGT